MKTMTKSLILLVFFGILSPSIIFADDFNPNFILSDEEMQNSQSMNRDDIQAFLNDKDGYISNLRTDDKDGVRRTSSDIIYRAATEYQINPKYLLVKLQKEQSLITDKNPSENQLNGATGYGINESCGWSCTNYLNNKGFGKQVDSAAGIIRWYYDNVNSQSWIKKAGASYTIDSTPVVPANFATAFLYTYTPHIQGNQNFWTLWQRWFDQVYPNGTLVTTVDNPSIYLIQDGKKRLITSMTALITRFDPKMIITVPSSELTRYDEGKNLSLPNYSILKNNNTYYLLDYDTLRPFESANVFSALGYNPDEVIDVTSGDIGDYELGKIITSNISRPTGELWRVIENKQLYFVKDNTYHPIYDPIIAENNYKGMRPIEVKASQMHDLTYGDPILLRDGTLVGITGSNKIYAIADGKKQHIANEQVFNGLGYKWSNIIWINELAGIAHQTAEPIYLNSAVVDTIARVDITEDEVKTASAGEMIVTPTSETKFIGPEFDTDIDSYLVADYDSKQILAGKNIDYVRPLASFTKVLTSYLALENGLDLNSSTAYNPSLHKSEYHRYRVAEGEKIKNSDLLDALLISSLNTPARMLVSNISDGEDAFITKMNNQVIGWG
ncbi:hypothetical protein KJ641_00485, partial [Patescibacteria group bacterium]|nr:hypothetical protein [Patescibacteria group bacterium]